MNRFLRGLLVGVGIATATAPQISCKQPPTEVTVEQYVERYANSYYTQVDCAVIISDQPVEVAKMDDAVIIQAANRQRRGWRKIEHIKKGNLEKVLQSGSYGEEKEFNIGERRITIFYNPLKYDVEPGDPHTLYLMKR